MEKHNLSISLRNLITKLLAQGLEPNYEEVLNFINNHSDYDEIYYLFYTLDHIKEDSLLLKLKIQEHKLHRIIRYLDMPQGIVPKDDGFIYIDATKARGQYYKITPEMRDRLKVVNIDYPEPGLTKTFYEVTLKEQDGTMFECNRPMEIDHNGKVIKMLSETHKPLTHPKYAQQESAETIYHGIVGELFEDLLKKDQPENKNAEL